MKKAEKKVAEFDYKRIKSFKDACKKENVDPAKLPDVSMIPEGMGKAILAMYRLFIIFQAINDGWTPDWGNRNQYKYFPWYWVLSSGFGFAVSHYYPANASTRAGSRLCTDSSEKALYIAKTFEQEYKEYLLILT